MGIFLQRRWLVCLAVIALVSCGNAKEEGGAVQQTAPPSAKVETPARGASATGATQTQQKLVILPATPTAKDSLRAVFQCDSGRVVCRWEKDGQLLDGEVRESLAPSHLQKGSIITVIVENEGKRYSESITIGNIPPVVSQVSFKNPAIHRDVDIELIVIGKDADDDDISFKYKWFRNGSQIDMIDGAMLPGDQFSRGDQISFQVIPFDGDNEGPPYEGSAITIPNAPPTFFSTPPLKFLAEAYSYHAQAIDPDDDDITYTLENPPPGMTINKKTGRINWPLAGLPAGEYRINLVAVDSQGEKGYQEYSLTMSRQ